VARQTTPKNAPVTKQVNVTNLTTCQKYLLFIGHLNQAGFSGFYKTRIDNQTYYTFTYKS
jgi:hypothetical protein